MLAALLTLGIFGIFCVVGLGLLALLRPARLTLGEALLAPTFGIAVLVIPTVLLNQLGLPVSRFAAAEVVLLAVGGAIAIAMRRHAIPWRFLAAFAPVIVVAYLLIGWPQFIHGFNWVADSNDDMTNYSLSADRIASQGYYQMPPLRPDELYRGYRVDYWFLNAAGGIRAGADELLALTVAIAHLRGFRAFMPQIIAGDLALISAIGALGWTLRRRARDAIAAGALGAVSAVVAHGTLVQLLAQVFGLALLTAAVVRLPDLSGPARSLRGTLLSSIPLAVIVAAMVLVYPEVLPFLVATAVGWLLVRILHRTTMLRSVVTAVAAVAAIVAVLTLENSYIMSSFLIGQFLGGVRGAVHAQHEFLFPYYVVPSGFANLWGLLPLAVYRGEPYLSISIAAGIALSALALVRAFRLARRGASPIPVMLGVMLLLAALLYVRQTGFGLFKLAMYAQPFLLVMLVPWNESRRGFGRAAVWASLALLVAANLAVQWRGVNVSEDGRYGWRVGFVEVRGATADRLLDALSDASRRLAGARAVVSDSSNLSIAKYELGYAGYRPLFFSSYAFLSTVQAPVSRAVARVRPRLAERARALLTENRSRPATFRFSKGSVTKFSLIAASGYKDPVYIESGSLLTILNRSYDAQNTFIRVSRLQHVRDHLVFINSSLGVIPMAGFNYLHTGLSAVEPDYFERRRPMSGLGRYLLLSVVNPSRPLRLLVSLTDSLERDGSNALPPMAVVGKRRVLFPIVGRGSARVISPPVTPAGLDGTYLVGLDMGRPARPFVVPRTGLMRMFGTRVLLDPRFLTTFGRDISAVDDAWYASHPAPTFLDDLSMDLRNPSLLYSGIYEDGWVSENAWVELSRPRKSSVLVVRGYVPGIDGAGFTTVLACSVDGRPVAARRLTVGPFDLKVRVKLAAGRHVVALRFSRFQRLPHGDGRPVAARLEQFGFVSVGRNE